MTANQRITLMAEWWPAACRTQGWDPKDRSKRLEVLEAAVGRPLTSASDLDNRTDIDNVKSHLGMLADNVQASIEVDHPELGEARRLKWKIRQLIAQLGQPYADKIARDKFGHARIDDMDNTQLRQFLITLNERQANHQPDQVHDTAGVASDAPF